jgi:hypothetical protein
VHLIVVWGRAARVNCVAEHTAQWRVIALDARKPGTLPVVAIDMTNIDLDESVLPIASDFVAFIDLIGIEAQD